MAALFGSYMFLNYSILYLGNRAGQGFLPANRQERVYYWLQIFVIAGYVCFAVYHKLRSNRKGRGFGRMLLWMMLAGLLSGGIYLALGSSSPVYLAVTFVTLLFLGFTGGAVYLRMAYALMSGPEASIAMGIGLSAAIAAQYLTQIGFRLPVLLCVLMAATAAFVSLNLTDQQFMESSGSSAVGGETVNRTTPRKILFLCLTTIALLLFPSFYNNYIHHLQILSGYGYYNVYTWPRLAWIPCYLVFGFIGGKKKGRFLPLAVLCMAMVALLNTVLSSVTDAYWLNMCLFYCSIGAATSFYTLRFWKTAPDTAWPALVAPLGRMLDSFMVIVQGVCGLGRLPGHIMLGLDVAALVAVIVLMTVNGDLDFRKSEEPVAAAALGPELRIETIGGRFGLTPRETEVLLALVSSEDDQQQLAAELGISTRTLQAHITSLYRKTGARNRAGLTRMVMEDRR